MVSNIKLLLGYCTHYYGMQFSTRTKLNSDIVSELEKLQKKYYYSNKPYEFGVPTVAHPGKELGISPKYLDDLLKKDTSGNVHEYIHFFVIERSKTNLLNSNN